MTAKLARERATDNLVENLLPRVKFVEPPSGSIICLLCKNVLRHPKQLSCGHRVCTSCDKNFEPDANGERHCPDDGELIERSFPDRNALTEIMNLGCFCLSNHEGCTWQGLLLDLEEHVKLCDYCAETVCPYHVLQCNFTGTRVKMDSHLRDDAIKHDCLLATCLKECLNDVEANKLTLNSIKEGTPSVERVFAEIGTEIMAFENKLKETSLQIGQHAASADQLKEQFDVFEELLSRGEKKKTMFIEFHEKFKHLLDDYEKQMAHIDGTERNDTGNSIATKKRTLIEKVKRLGESNETHGKQINEVGIKIRIAQCSNNDGNYTWKLDNLKNRFTQGTSGELYTPPLYTSNFGYKYSAKIMLNGDKRKTSGASAGTSKHMAFFIVLMQGDYDEILQFPFPYPIEITLVNLSNKQDITHTLYPDPQKAHFQKPYKNMNPAIGFARFCSHEKLNTGGFIKNDTIYFRITVKKAGLNVKEPNI